MSAIRDAIFKNATGEANFIASAKALDPPLAASLTEKSLLGSKSVWFPLFAWLLTALVGRLGIGLDPDTVAYIASVLAYLVVIAVRYITRSPIGSVLPQGKDAAHG